MQDSFPLRMSILGTCRKINVGGKTYKKMEKENGFVMAEDAGRGYRRVVPSPEPKKIHGVEEIKTLSE